MTQTKNLVKRDDIRKVLQRLFRCRLCDDFGAGGRQIARNECGGYDAIVERLAAQVDAAASFQAFLRRKIPHRLNHLFRRSFGYLTSDNTVYAVDFRRICLSTRFSFIRDSTIFLRVSSLSVAKSLHWQRGLAQM